MKKELIIEPSQLTPSHDRFTIIGVFNPAVIFYKNKFIMIARVAEKVNSENSNETCVATYHQGQLDVLKFDNNDPLVDLKDPRLVRTSNQTYLTSLSHLRVGWSADGIHFKFPPDGILLPQNQYEEFGMEDPRITFIKGKYYITYTAVSSYGINTGLMVTKDFKSFQRLGLVFHSDNKDVVIFPQLIKGHYWALHRPSTSEFGHLDIWTAQSDNLLYWGNHQVLVDARTTYAPFVRIGAGAVPFLTRWGWVVIYHVADEQNHYDLTAMVLDKDNPQKVLFKSRKPLVTASEPYELKGFMNEVVFTCGAVVKDKELWIYYGVCDQAIAVAKLTMQELAENLGVTI